MNKETVNEKRNRFSSKPLTEEQRKKYSVERYYRPYRILDDKSLGSRAVFWAGKRVFDFIVASIALVILFPVILVCLLAVWIEDPSGSPLFVQDRVGRRGKVFRFYKVRSMHVDAEKQLEKLSRENEFGGKAFKIKDDPRVTKVGRFLRNTSLDELPQLVNIIKGDMSIVGPRPPLPREVEQYDEYERQRLFVTPGLTCFWQVLPNRHEVSFEDWVALDIKYVAEYAWRVDLKLILRTALQIFRGNND